MRNAQRDRILATPQCKRDWFANRVIEGKSGRSAVVGAHRLRDVDQKTGLTFGVRRGNVRGCHLNGGETQKVTDAAASGCDHIAGK